MLDILGLLAMTGAQNPDVFAQAMASQGISPAQAGGLMSAGQGLAGVLPQTGTTTGSGVPGISLGTGTGLPMDPGNGALGALLASPVGDATMAGVGGTTTASVPGGAGAVNPLVAMAGNLKVPTAPAPIMNAGVSGSQKAPDMAVKAGGGANMQILQALLAATQGSAPAVPGLGALLKGV